jgi:hypothetical protein
VKAPVFVVLLCWPGLRVSLCDFCAALISDPLALVLASLNPYIKKSDCRNGQEIELPQRSERLYPLHAVELESFISFPFSPAITSFCVIFAVTGFA